jgi:DNA-directed RNA polymerase II subunit RPB2
MSTFTVHTDPRFVRRLLPELGVANLEFVVTARKFVRSAKVFVNGRWEGCHEKPVELVDELRRLRRSGLVHPHTCIYWNIRHQEIQIWTTGGRMVRPLYIVDPDTNRLRIQGRHYEQLRMGKMSWDDLLGGRYQPTPECPDLEESPTDIALIEYIDPLETENCMIAMTVDDLQASHSDMRLEYTHCEIHPSLMLSAVIGDVPFPNHSHAPRVIYWGNMGRQSIGIHATNYKQRMDTMAPLLYYPQLPLISTRTSRYTFTRELPTGQMCIVAIASYSGYNQEDSVILNGDSVDRGLFIRAMRKTYKDVEKHTNTEGQGEERIEFPPPNTINMRSDYSAIDQKTGLPLEGSFVRPGSVILSKVVRTTGSDMIQYKDTSMMLKNGEAGKIDRVELTTTAEGYKQALIGVRQERIPEIGDKFASRMAQKGTIGIILPREDMPFTADGIVPDIIINPHCMPSRMTISQLIEMLFSKVCAIKGIEGDGSPFQGLQIDDVARLLGTPVSEGGCGFQDITSPDGGSFGDGHEVMYSGLTGTQFPARVFMGPCYYVSLKHMVQDKAHSRSTGAVQPLTRQPAEGRSRDGGLRLGEMERDCMISHGAASFQREKFMDCSDFFSVWIDRKTGFIAKGDPTKDTITLRDGQQDLRAVYIPYSFKVLVQELMAMGIGMRFRVD